MSKGKKAIFDVWKYREKLIKQRDEILSQLGLMDKFLSASLGGIPHSAMAWGKVSDEEFKKIERDDKEYQKQYIRNQIRKLFFQINNIEQRKELISIHRKIEYSYVEELQNLIISTNEKINSANPNNYIYIIDISMLFTIVYFLPDNLELKWIILFATLYTCIIIKMENKRYFNINQFLENAKKALLSTRNDLEIRKNKIPTFSYAEELSGESVEI